MKFSFQKCLRFAKISRDLISFGNDIETIVKLLDVDGYRNRSIPCKTAEWEINRLLTYAIRKPGILHPGLKNAEVFVVTDQNEEWDTV